MRLKHARNRKAGIPLLMNHFVEKYSRRMGKQLGLAPQDTVALLLRYDWPGNVRELENVIERAVITATDGRLNLDRALPEASSTGTSSIEKTLDPPDRIRTAKELEELERTNILRALDAANWKVSGDKGAANLLGINASTLSSRMKALKIQKPDSR